MDAKTTAVAKVNDVDILIIEGDEKRVAIKPICQALGIDHDVQRKRLNDDPILSSVTVLSTATGADGKQYKMVTIPFEYVFGWLFLIDSRKVNPEVRESVLRYQKECYHALYAYFTRHDDYLKHREKLMVASFEKQEQARYNFSQAGKVLDEAKKEFKDAMLYTENDWLAENTQLQMNFSEGTEEGHV